MTATPYLNMNPKQMGQIKQIEPNEPSFAVCFCIPLRVACLIMGYMTLFYSSLISMCLLGLLTWIIFQVGGIGQLMSSGFLLGEFLLAHILSIIIFVLLLNIFAIVLTIMCLVGIHKERPQLMIWHISFTTARMLIIVATLGYNLLAGLNLGLLISQLTDICITIYYIQVFKTYMNQLHKKVASESNNNSGQSGEIKKVPIV